MVSSDSNFYGANGCEKYLNWLLLTESGNPGCQIVSLSALAKLVGYNCVINTSNRHTRLPILTTSGHQATCCFRTGLDVVATSGRIQHVAQFTQTLLADWQMFGGENVWTTNILCIFSAQNIHTVTATAMSSLARTITSLLTTLSILFCASSSQKATPKHKNILTVH